MISNIPKGQQCGNSVVQRFQVESCDSFLAMIMLNKYEVKVTAGRIIPALAMALNGLAFFLNGNIFLVARWRSTKMEAIEDVYESRV